ncbi:unnamed protein product [Trichogramma brassicae]|uniref:Secreted protein n=1 Tax=Trichogramma brassicae TaxID=86971 RepID=A0A6H5I2V4_9HYME|nr:unnamed protein product [Trichogramma brassicae]
MLTPSCECRSRFRLRLLSVILAASVWRARPPPLAAASQSWIVHHPRGPPPWTSCFITVEANELTTAQPKCELSIYATTVFEVNGCPAAFHKDSRSRANLEQQNSTCSESSSSVGQEGHVARSSCKKRHKYALKHPCSDSS